MRTIPGHSMYSITDDGRVWSHHRNRWIRNTVRTYNGSGYHRVGLLISSSPKKYKYYYVHQLVMLTYIGKCPIGMEIDHVDLDTGNNYISNLRYVTHIENVKSRRTWRGGSRKKGDMI